MVFKIEQDPNHESANARNKVPQSKPESARDANARDTVASESGAAYDWMGHCLPFDVCEW
ncbi:hypothetical protein P3T18_000441 [Paraburkholderia sp. GAS199]|uniref:hypothetical protein n=1 Tax=Paraburkholderia sp. GAS199 TaxID=3035126 RepID=UPI003D1E22AD